MNVLIGALEFDGPFADLDLLSDVSGIYAILCENAGEYELLELGDSEYVREQIQNHPGRTEWHQSDLNIAVAVHYTADLADGERIALRQELEREFDVEIAA